jgi:uncharacterized protein (DUF2252 family)
MDIVRSTSAYERWLKAQLHGDIVPKDIDRKHRRMGREPFEFLRATFWRWAEIILDVCPELANAPSVLAVGDIHVENFGTWHDAEGRLVWGVNDFDESAEMPYVLDLVRLATSVVLADVRSMPVGAACRQILDGYRAGLAEPQALVLDRQHAWLRKSFPLPAGSRAAFWKNFDPARNVAEARRSTPQRRYVSALKSALPAAGIDLAYWPRTAGTGSLGRPRWVGFGLWRDAPLVREAKAMVASGWTRAHGPAGARLRCEEIASARHRSPDPWYRLKGTVLVRRLSPNNRKLDLAEVDAVTELVNDEVLWAMGRDLAAIHLGTGDHQAAIARDLARRKPQWLRTATKAAAAFVRREHKEWRKVSL